MLRNSERQTFKKCRHLWQWNFFERRQAIVPALALTFGDMVHIALADYYQPGRKRGPLPAETFERLYDERAAELHRTGWYSEDEEGDRKWEDAGQLGVLMLEGYVPHWQDRDAQFEVIASEMTFQHRIREPMSGEPLIVVGTIDGLWRDLAVKKGRHGLLWIEHKTAASIAVDGLALDEQAGTYWTYGPKHLRKIGLLPPDAEPEYIWYNYLRKAAPNPEWTYDTEGRKLNKPTKPALVEEYKRLGRKYPQGTGANGAVLVDDMIADLGEPALLLGEISASQPAPFFVREPVYRDHMDKVRQHERILAEFRDIHSVEEAVRAGHVEAAYKTPGPQHMPNCRGCPVRDPCELHETGNDALIMLNEITQPWDPYSAHNRIERR